jgi:hypothetical protein
MKDIVVTHISVPLFKQKIGQAINTIVEKSFCSYCGSSEYGIVRADSMISDIFCLNCSTFIDTVCVGDEYELYPWAVETNDQNC